MNDECSIEELTAEASLISSVVMSVIRDRSLSSAYGFFLALLKEEGAVDEVPSLDSFFAEITATRLRMDIEKVLGKDALSLPLYSDEGDLFGQLARLLVVCNETLFRRDTALIEKADEKIAQIDFGHDVADGRYIRHLRNAVLHSHFEVLLDKDNPFKTVIHFWDAKPKTDPPVITGDYRFTADSLNELIGILINDVCLEYLSNIGWILA